MKFRIFAAVIALTLGALSLYLHQPAPSSSTCPPPPTAPVAGQQLLELAHQCAQALYPRSEGVGGNPLRFDAMSLSPHTELFAERGAVYQLPEPRTSVWHVRIEEEHPHTSIPNGAEFTVHAVSGDCAHVPMD